MDSLRRHGEQAKPPDLVVRERPVARHGRIRPRRSLSDLRCRSPKRRRASQDGLARWRQLLQRCNRQRIRVQQNAFCNRGRRPLQRSTPRRKDTARKHFLVRRLPPCQSSSLPTDSASTPKLASRGRSRRLRLISAKPGKPASAMTWSHSSAGVVGIGSRLITGPKNAVPPGGWKCRIGVPTSRPVRTSASSVSARISSSSAGRRARPRDRSADRHRATRARAMSSRTPGRTPTADQRRETCRRSGRRVPRRAGRPRRGRAPHAPARRPAAAAGPRCARPRSSGEVRRVVDVRIEDPQRNEPPVDAVVALGGHDADPLAGQPRERADRVEIEMQVVFGVTARRPRAGSRGRSRTDSPRRSGTSRPAAASTWLALRPWRHGRSGRAPLS